LTLLQAERLAHLGLAPDPLPSALLLDSDATLSSAAAPLRKLQAASALAARLAAALEEDALSRCCQMAQVIAACRLHIVVCILLAEYRWLNDGCWLTAGVLANCWLPADCWLNAGQLLAAHHWLTADCSLAAVCWLYSALPKQHALQKPAQQWCTHHAAWCALRPTAQSFAAPCAARLASATAAQHATTHPSTHHAQRTTRRSTHPSAPQSSTCCSNTCCSNRCSAAQEPTAAAAVPGTTKHCNFHSTHHAWRGCSTAPTSEALQD
jgi:hypothetical protein